MSKEYDLYLIDHKRGVKMCLYLLATEPTLIKNLSDNKIKEIAMKHDLSKYSKEEYQAYNDRFYGEHYNQEEFDKAWLHHIHHNPHHWEHWLLLDDGEVKALEMPNIYILEMVADWGSFAYNKKDSTELLTWYSNNKYTMVLHPNTRKKVENLVITLSNKMSKCFEQKEV